MPSERNRGVFTKLCRSVAELSPIDLALRLTLLDLLLRPIGDFALRPFILSLAAAGLLLPGWGRGRSLWLLLSALTALRVILDWPLADNHAYLLAYWCLAVFLSLSVADTERTLALNGRMLIGLTFAFAALWKVVLSPDYLDGTFFHVTLLDDPRFEGFARIAGAATPEQLKAWRDILGTHIDGPAIVAGEIPSHTPRLVGLAQVVTLWTAAIELALAVVFLWPLGRGPSRLRDPVLLLFCASSYAVATVEGFAWLLLAMGVAQCHPAQSRMRWAYTATFALILFYREVPWAELLMGRLST
jgi:hypothetical protein